MFRRWNKVLHWATLEPCSCKSLTKKKKKQSLEFKHKHKEMKVENDLWEKPFDSFRRLIEIEWPTDFLIQVRIWFDINLATRIRYEQCVYTLTWIIKQSGLLPVQTIWWRNTLVRLYVFVCGLQCLTFSNFRFV